MQKKSDDPVFTRMFFIRHGQSEWNQKGLIQGTLDIPLNETGIQQAKALAQLLATRYSIDIIYSSPASRALRTAKYINENFNVDLFVNENLAEIDFGDLVKHAIADLDKVHAEYMKAFRHFTASNRSLGTSRPDLPGGEPYPHVEIRIHSFIKKILSEHKGKKIAVVSHGSFLRCLLTILAGGSLKNHIPYWIENASLSVVDFYGTLPIIRLLNEISHLDNGLDFITPNVI